jgi:hypothetical protein
MFQSLGIALIVISLAGTAWWIGKNKVSKAAMVFLCMIAVFAGIFLIVSERATEVTVEKVGSIKAAVRQATDDAKQIAEIKERIIAQGATVDLVAKETADSKKLTDELARQNVLADQKLKQLDDAIKTSTEALSELQRYTQFNTAVLAAQTGSRMAFDQLRGWAEDKSFPLSVASAQAWGAVMDSHESPLMSTGFNVSWRDGFDPAKSSLDGLKQVFKSSHPPQSRLGIMEYIWRRQDIPKKDRLSFLVEVMKTDPSLQVVEYAARYFKEESKDNFKNLYIEGHLKWWDEHKNEVQ